MVNDFSVKFSFEGVKYVEHKISDLLTPKFAETLSEKKNMEIEKLEQEKNSESDYDQNESLNQIVSLMKKILNEIDSKKIIDLTLEIQKINHTLDSIYLLQILHYCRLNKIDSAQSCLLQMNQIGSSENLILESENLIHSVYNREDDPNKILTKEFGIWATSYLNLDIGSTLLQLGNLDESFHYLKIAKQFIPHNLEIDYKIGRWYVLNNDYTKAIKQFQSILEVDDNPSIYQALSECYFRLENYQQALSIVESGLELHYDDISLLHSKCFLLVHLSQPDKAIPLFDQTLQLDPDNRFSLYGKAECLRMLSHYDQAIPLFDQALQLDPDDAFSLYGKAQCLQMLGQHDHAIPLFDQALQLVPDDALLLRGKAECHITLHQYDNAIHTLEKILKITDDENFKEEINELIKEITKKLK